MNQQDIEQVVKAVLLKMQSSDTPSAAVHEMGVFVLMPIVARQQKKKLG